mmetsp:Transcript_10098/g.23021  ORF Transcript_10098/g.23021 Transcript_10098/m.23021 type:complete len:260 (-) Transcript_10098:383-1162(-)
MASPATRARSESFRRSASRKNASCPSMSFAMSYSAFARAWDANSSSSPTSDSKFRSRLWMRWLSSTIALRLDRMTSSRSLILALRWVLLVLSPFISSSILFIISAIFCSDLDLSCTTCSVWITFDARLLVASFSCSSRRFRFSISEFLLATMRSYSFLRFSFACLNSNCRLPRACATTCSSRVRTAIVLLSAATTESWSIIFPVPFNMSRGVQPELSRDITAAGYEAMMQFTTSQQAPHRTAACNGSSPKFDWTIADSG